jgi:putative methyltransferase (TIGR04325 family)
VSKTFLKSLLPPVLLGPARRMAGTAMRFDGPVTSWMQATRASDGYESSLILNRMVDAAREVAQGKAAFERDGVTFSERSYRYPVVSALLRAAALNAGRLHVIDYGGALGSTYWQCRPLLHGLEEVRWVVVEQQAVVAAGAAEFATPTLSFANSLAEAAKITKSPLILASSVLQYLPDPIDVLEEMARCDAKSLLIDRTPVSNATEDAVCVQHAARRVYRASYPVWVFSRQRLKSRLATHWDLVDELTCEEGLYRSSRGLRFEFVGAYLERSH